MSRLCSWGKPRRSLGVAAGWEGCVSTPHARRSYVTDVTWGDLADVSALVPDENRSNAGFCLSNEKDLYLVYGGSDNSRLHVKLPQGVEGTLHSTWFDPYTGDFLKGSSKRNETFQSYEIPKQGQPWILIVELEGE